MHGIAKKNCERLPTSPLRVFEFDPARHEVRADGMDAYVPQAGLPAQVWVRPQADPMGEQSASQDHQGHEITAPIEGTPPANQHHHGAHKQK